MSLLEEHSCSGLVSLHSKLPGFADHGPRGKIPGELTSVELILKCDLDCILRERDRTCGAHFGVDACNSSSEEVCLGEIELIGEEQSGHGRGGIDLCEQARQ